MTETSVNHHQHCNQMIPKQSSLLRQKSRISWLKEGDCNSGYFHRIINFRRAFNAIPGISIDGVWDQQPNTVKNAAVNYFQTRFSEQDYSRPFLDRVPFKATKI